jgi:hypothetical protein
VQEEILVFGGYSKIPENCFGYSVANSEWVTIPAKMNAQRRTPSGAMSSEGLLQFRSFSFPWPC